MSDPVEDASEARLVALLEAALFASPEPISLAHLAYALGETPERTRELLDILAGELARPRHGLMLRVLAGGYQIITKPEHHEGLREMVENLPPPAPLSEAAVETAAIIAYKQPITAAEVQALRGVRNREGLRTLLKRKIIAPAGRAKTRGTPVRYKTTRRFLVEFGLESLKELPSLDELRQRSGFPLDLEILIPSSPSTSSSTPAADTPPPSQESLRPSQKSLPMTDRVTLAPGRLEIRFSGAQDLLGRLFDLPLAISNDFQRSEALLEE